MPGYTHNCGNCGAEMQVHSRYAGRTLKCTSCRTEFVAEMPEGDFEPQTNVVAPSEPVPEKSPRRFLPLLLLLIPLVGFFAWLGGDDDPPETAFREQHAVGDVASLDTGTTRPVLVATDQEAVGALVDMRTGSIQLGVSSLMTNDERYLEADAGTKARILLYANEDREARVELLEGQWKGEKVWVPRRWLR